MLAVIIVFLVLLIIGMPVAFAIGLAGALFFIISPFVPYSIAVQKVVSSTQSLNMLSIPLFIFAGNLMNETGITKKLIQLSDTLVGHLPGHLGQISCVLSTLMGGVSGSANADAAMECRVLGPDMIRSGYSRGWSAAINGVSSLIVATIPPSMGLIIYGSVGDVSIGKLFIGGLLPGILMCACMMTAVHLSAKKRGYRPARTTRPTAKEVGKALLDSVWALMFPLILIVGIRMGIMTPLVGIALYTTSEIMECKPQETAKEAIPFYIAMLFVILVIAFVPQVTMLLPNLVFK